MQTTRKRDASALYDITHLYTACSHGTFEQFCEVLESGADVNGTLPPQYSGTPLIQACLRSDWETSDKMVRMLLQRGARAEVVGSAGVSALMCAVRRASPAVVAMLLCASYYGPVVDTKSGASVLTLCAGKRVGEDGLKITSMLLVKDVVPIDYQNANGETALHLACRGNSVEMVHLLIHHGANTEVVSKNGNTVMWYACQNARHGAKIIPLLISKGVDVMFQIRGWTAMRVAASAGCSDVMRALEPYFTEKQACYGQAIWLFEHDVLATMRCAKSQGFDPGNMSIDYQRAQREYRPGKTEWTVLRANNGPVLDGSSKDPFVYVSKDNNPAIWRYVANELGDTIHPMTRETLLHVAARTGKAFAVKLLMARGLNPLRQNKDGLRPLQLATEPATAALLKEYTCFRPTVTHARWFGPFFCARAYTFLLMVERWRRKGVRVVYKDVVNCILWHLGNVEEV